MNQVKPLGRKCYGSIGHLPGSRLGPGDHRINDGQARILTVRPRDRHDRIIVSEKLDGSNVGVANIGGATVALGRSGYLAQTSSYEQHQLFAAWVRENGQRFLFLKDGERVCGEWLAQAHGTRYRLNHDPFVAFDIMRGDERAVAVYEEFAERIARSDISVPTVLFAGQGESFSIAQAMHKLGEFGFHGALEPAEGAVWRVERQGKVDFLGKYVRPNKVDGRYLPELTGSAAVWNWRPTTPDFKA